MKNHFLRFASALVFLTAGSTSLFAQLNFTANTTNGCKPLVVTFTNTTTHPNAYRYEWNFWDGSPVLIDTMPTTVTHTFTSPGYYPVQVQVFDNTGGSLGSTQGSSGAIQVNGIDFMSPDSTCIGDQISFCPSNFTNSASWDYGDGNTSSQSCGLYGFATLGTYTVTLVANGPNCGTETIKRKIVVSNNASPHPSAFINGIQNNLACTNQPLNFSGSGTYSTYLWKFGDGAQSTLQSPQHTYTATGVYNYSLTVVNGCGKSGSYTNSVSISNTVPFPTNIGIGTPSQACPGQQVNIYAYGVSNGQFPKIVWNFGDGTPKDSSNSNVNHTYASVNSYTITCRIYSYCGTDTLISKAFNVTSYAPFPNNTQINANPAIACPNSNVNFDASWGYASYQWNFGDGSPVQTTNNNYTSHQYGGTLTTYTASVKITSSCGNDTTVTRTVLISNTAHFPTQNFSLGGNSPVCPNSNVNFNAPQGYVSYLWNFGDGTPASTTTDYWSNHTYGPTVTTYTATVKVTNSCGFDTTISKTIQVLNNIKFPNQSWFKLESMSPICPNSSANFNAPNGYSTYQWNFGDGSPVQTTSGNNNPNNINHTYGSTITTYTASVKITNGCGNDTTLYRQVQISNTAPFPSDSWFQLDVQSSPSCPSSNVGFSAPGGYSYEWNFGDGSPSFTSINKDVNHVYGSTLTTYTVSVKITNGCGNDTTLYGTVQIMANIGFPNDSWFKLQTQPSPACPNDEVGFNAPGGYSSYAWNFGDGNTASGSKEYVGHTYTANGTYSVSVIITNGCGNDTTLYANPVVSNAGVFSNWLNINVTPSSGSCPNDLMDFRFEPKGYNSFFWNFGDGDTITSQGSNIQHSYTATGTYTVSCKVKNGCGNTTTIYSTVSIMNNAPVSNNLELAAVQNPACKDDEVFFVPNGGQSTYSYIWNFGDGSPADTSIGAGTSHSYSATGSYTVTAIVTNGCGSTGTITVTQVISNSAVPSLTSSDGRPNWGFPGGEGGGGAAGCAGDAIIFYFMGSATSNMWHFGDGDSGMATEHMLVYGGDGSFPVTVIKHAYDTNGTYKVYLTITNGCGNSVTDSMTITIGGGLLVDGDMTTSPPPFSTCASIDFLGFGGTIYDWNFGDGNTLSTISPTVSHTYATQGVYVATVLIENGCGNTATYSRSVNVSGAGGPSVGVASNTSPTCVGGSNGSAAVSATSGFAPYTYSWSGGQTTSAVAGLPAGLYYATVTDNIGCSSTLGVTVNDPAAIVITGSTTNASCGSSDGTATATITSGGTPAYTFAWSNGQTTSTAVAMSVGSYSVLVTDGNGCTSSKNISVSEANGAALTVNTVTNTSCFGGSDGSLTVNISGGTPPYTYAWSSGATTQNISGLAAGNYSVIVTDNSACKATLNATVAQPTAIVVTASVVKDPNCGKFDGTATATVTGGTAPYTYLWDPGTGGVTTQQADSLPAGSYTVTVIDSKGCSKDGVVSLSNSNSPVLSAVVSDVSCNGGSNGAIDLTVTGGTSPYLYVWSVNPPNNIQDISNLIPGSYFVTVTDKKGCQSFRLYTVSQPAVLSATVTNTGVTCGNTDGTATASISGGNTPYTYSWTGGQTTQTATGLSAGSKTVTVTDKKGCAASGTTTLSATTTAVSICMVTVDSTSTRNHIVWEKPAVSNIDSFFIYREIASVFTYVGGIPYAATSMFTDTTNGVNPNITSYRYEIATNDNCGGTSAKSAPHRTINLSVNPHSPCGYTLFWNDYSGFPISQYRIWCDSSGSGWKAIDSVSYGTTQWIDNKCYTPQDSIEYLVEIDHPNGCVASIANPAPEAVNLNSSKSNVYRSSATSTGLANRAEALAVSAYPNPNNGMFVIDMRHTSGPALIKVFNVLGEEVKQINSTGRSKIPVDLSRQSKGVYLVQVSSAGKLTTQKIIIQ